MWGCKANWTGTLLRLFFFFSIIIIIIFVILRNTKEPEDDHFKAAQICSEMYQCISHNKRVTQPYKKVIFLYS